MWSFAWPWAFLALPLPIIVRKLVRESPAMQDAGLKVPSLSYFTTLTQRPGTDQLLSWRFWLAAGPARPAPRGRSDCPEMPAEIGHCSCFR